MSRGRCARELSGWKVSTSPMLPITGSGYCVSNNPLTEFYHAIFTLRPSLGFSYIGSDTARHSSSGRQPNFAAWSTWYKEWNYRTFAPRHFQHKAPPIFRGRPPRRAEAHIVAFYYLRVLTNCDFN